MVRGKGKGTVKGNNASNTFQSETTVSGNIEMNGKEIGVAVESKDKEKNEGTDVVNEENALAVMNSVDIVIEKGKNLETAMEEEEEKEEHEENIMELEGDKKNEPGTIAEEDEEEENAADEEVEEEDLEEEGEEEEEENEEQAMEEEENKEQAMEEEENKEQVMEQEKNEVKVTANSDEKVKGLRKRGRRGRRGKRRDSETVAAESEVKPGSSRNKKVSKRAESMGLIFMCSSKTKKDCYNYKVLGLPASKRDVVQKVYKGMRLFLFDVDLRLMYGIYKAAGPGGYNIEPQAFNSAFPSQVRFTVLEDCLPLAEEKFKSVIKDNYYSRTKFHCELTEEKVKKLCQLFVATSGSKKLGRNHREETRTYTKRDRIRRRSPDGKRRPPLRSDRRYHDRPIMYERESYASRVEPLPRLHHVPAPPAPLYASYGRALEMDVYRHDPRVERLDHRFSVADTRRQDEIGRLDPYIVYREPPPTYHEPLYSAGLGLRPEHSPYAGLVGDYRPVAVAVAGQLSERRHPAAAAPSEYRLYRY